LRGLGKVAAIEGDALTVENRRGTFEVLTNDDTVFRVRGVESPSIDDLHVGDVVAGIVARQDDGSLLARVIAVVPPQAQRLRGLGRVAAIEGDALTVENRRGTFEVLTNDDTVFRVRGVEGTFEVLTNDDTVFRVRGVEDPSIDDLHVGDVVAGIVARQDDGSLLARALVVLPGR